MRFTPDAERRVVLTAQDNPESFVTSNKKLWRWAADLKPEHAQRLAADIGRQFSRVGVNEPEILLRSRERS